MSAVEFPDRAVLAGFIDETGRAWWTDLRIEAAPAAPPAVPVVSRQWARDERAADTQRHDISAPTAIRCSKQWDANGLLLHCGLTGGHVGRHEDYYKGRWWMGAVVGDL